jgi:hypothetical protein
MSEKERFLPSGPEPSVAARGITMLALFCKFDMQLLQQAFDASGENGACRIFGNETIEQA